MGIVAHLQVKVSAAIGDFEKQMASLERSFDRTGSKLQSVGSRLTAGVTLPIVALGGAAIKAAVDFEDAFSGVAKTVDGVANSKGELTAFGKELKQQFRDLAKTIPITVGELAKIGETAGAMGIPKDKILQFTEVMAKLGSTTDLTSDQAAASIGKIQNVYQAAGVETDRFASTLVALGNAGASTESQILGFAERMGGAAVQANISQAEVLGWSNAMASVGLNAELGSTAWNKVSSNIGMAVDLGGAKLQAFAAVAGMTADAFSKMWRADASEAMLRVVEGFGKIKDSGGNVTKVMNDLGMKTSGIQMTFKNLAASGDMVRQSLDLGKKAWQDNTAMQEEFQKKAATVAAQMQVLWNKLYDVGISLGEVLIPAMLKLLPAVENVLGALVQAVSWFSQLPEPIQTAGIALVALVAAIGPVTYAVGTLMRAVGALGGLWTTAAASVGGFSLSFGTLAAAVAKASAVLGAFWAGWSIGRAIDLTFTINGMSPSEWATALWNFGMGLKGISWEDAKAGAVGHRAADTANSRPGAGARGGDTHLGPEGPGISLPGIGGGGSSVPTAPARPNQFGGADVFTSARQMMADLQQIGGLTKLTDGELQQLNSTLGAALDKYAALGRVAPKAMFDTYVATLQVRSVSGMGGLEGVGAVDLDALRAAGMPIPPMPVPVGHTTGLDNIAGQLPGATALPGMPQLPGMFSGIFGNGANLGGNILQAVMGGLQGGGGAAGIAQNLGGMLGGQLAQGIGGNLLGNVATKLGTQGIAGMLGGAITNFIPMIGPLVAPLVGKLVGFIANKFGNAGRDLVKDFAADHGGFDKLHEKLGKMGKEGEELWIKLTQGVGRNNPEQAKKVIEEVGAALEAWPEKKAEAIASFVEGAALRVSAFADAFKQVNAQGQPDFLNALGGDTAAVQQEFATMGLYAGTAFATTLKEHGIQRALQDAGPMFQQLIAISQQHGFALEGSAAQMAAFYQTAQQHAPVIQALEGITMMIKGAGDALFLDQQLFTAFGNDAVVQWQRLTEGGVAANQALAFMQPTLQALWEAQNKFGFATDEATQALIDQGVQQGIVGAGMQDTNTKILNVLMAIGDVLGAKIPAALRGLPGEAAASAAGVKAAFDGVEINIPVKVDQATYGDVDVNLPNGGDYTVGEYTVPQMARGGIVPARRGGTLVNVGEGGQDEAVIPLGSSGLSGGGGSTTAILEIDGRRFAEVVVPHIPGVVKRYGLA